MAFFYLCNDELKQLESGNIGNNATSANTEIISARSDTSASPIVAAWNTRQVVKYNSETNMAGKSHSISTVCLPVKRDGFVLGILKLMLQQKNRKTGGKANSTFVSMLEQISTYCAPVVSLILWRNDAEVEIASREMQVKAFEANLSASLESAKSTNQRLETEKEALYKDLEVANETLETTKFELLSNQRALAKLERDNEILEAKIEEAPSTNINEEVLRITNEYQTLKRKYRTQSARFERVVNLLKAYPQYEAPVGYDALDMLTSLNSSGTPTKVSRHG